MTCEHIPYIPKEFELMPDFCVMNLKSVKIHLCAKCKLIYYEVLK